MPGNVMHGVETLLHSKPPAISYAEQTAATRFATDYLCGVEGVRQESTALRSGSADAHDVAIGRAMALGRYRDIADRLGPEVTRWLVSFTVFDLSFVAMGDRYWPGETGRKEMRGAMATVLRLLSLRYAQLDGRRKPRAP